MDHARTEIESYVRQVASSGGGGGGGVASELEKAKAILDSGAINDQEYSALKAKLLA